MAVASLVAAATTVAVASLARAVVQVLVAAVAGWEVAGPVAAVRAAGLVRARVVSGEVGSGVGWALGLAALRVVPTVVVWMAAPRVGLAASLVARLEVLRC